MEIKPIRKQEYETPFDAIKGYEVEIDRVKAVCSALKAIEDDMALFPSGIMFSGSPGTGKTTLAKAFMTELGYPCYAPGPCPTSQSLALLYDSAGKHTPCFVFLDDVDRILSDDGDQEFVSDESRACLKELLSRLDGAEKSDGVITVMTSNQYWALDDAIKRSGRIDLHIPLSLPNGADRKKIAEFYMAQFHDFFPNDGGTLAEIVADKSFGMSGADLKLVIKDVYLLNYPASKELDEFDFAEAFQKRILEVNNGGILKRNFQNDDDYLRICCHEAGHAILNWALLGKASDICCLQTNSSSNSGWTASRQTDYEKLYLDEDDFRNEIAIMLGGMVAEKIMFGKASAGAAADLENSMETISTMLFYCCNGDFSYLPAFLPNSGSSFGNTSEQTKEYVGKVQETEQRIITECYGVATKVLEENKDTIDYLGRLLVQKGSLSAEKVENIFKKRKVHKPEEEKPKAKKRKSK